MSRSHKRSPFMGMTDAPSEKRSKSRANRKERRLVRQRLTQVLGGGPVSLPHRHECGDPWTWEKDGRQRFDPSDAELMRK